MRSDLVLVSSPLGTEEEGIDEVPACVADDVVVEVSGRVKLEVSAHDLALRSAFIPLSAHLSKLPIVLRSYTPDPTPRKLLLFAVIPKDEEQVRNAVERGDVCRFACSCGGTSGWNGAVETRCVNSAPNVRSLDVRPILQVRALLASTPLETGQHTHEDLRPTLCVRGHRMAGALGVRSRHLEGVEMCVKEFESGGDTGITGASSWRHPSDRPGCVAGEGTPPRAPLPESLRLATPHLSLSGQLGGGLKRADIRPQVNTLQRLRESGRRDLNPRPPETPFSQTSDMLTRWCSFKYASRFAAHFASTNVRYASR